MLALTIGFGPELLFPDRAGFTQSAAAFAAEYPAGADGFGSSDCSCESHLFFSPEDPLDSRRFHKILQGFRMVTAETIT